jgi:hypothetical protein
LRKLIKSVAAEGFSSGEFRDIGVTAHKTELNAARQGYWDKLLMGPGD